LKICKECNQILPLEAFGKHPYSADGLEYRCRNCKNFLLREYRRLHPEWTKQKRDEHYIKGCDRSNILLRRTWNAMNVRCGKKDNYQYHRYGGRGIKIEWKNFEDFKKDMSSGFEKGLTIERKDNDGNYSADNCRWASHIDQSNNTSRNVFFEFEGKKQTLAQIARTHNVNYKMLWKRVNRRGLTIERALQEALK